MLVELLALGPPPDMKFGGAILELLGAAAVFVIYVIVTALASVLALISVLSRERLSGVLAIFMGSVSLVFAAIVINIDQPVTTISLAVLAAGSVAGGLLGVLRERADEKAEAAKALSVEQPG